MGIFQFTGFENADLFGSQSIRTHLTFTMPAEATLDITVEDDDHSLSGDHRRNEQSDDRSEQFAALDRGGEEVGTGGRLYAENLWRLRGDDGKTYHLVELEQPGNQPDSFTFFGDVPPAGVTLSVRGRANVRDDGLAYDKLSAGNSVSDPAPNIVEIAAGSDDFNILVKALSAAGLVEAVQNSDDITVFAPTDAAFTQLAVDLGFDGDASDEDAVFGFIAGALAGLAEDGDPIPLLTDVLLYHVSPGAKTAAEVDAADAIHTLLTDATFGSEGSELIDNEPDVANPNIVGPDIAASNGTIQVIDRVLIPLDIPGNTPEPPADLPTLTEIVAASGGVFDHDETDFDLLLNAVGVAGLAEALDDPEAELTVFAPNDAAFVGLSQTLGFEGTDEGEAFDYLVEALTLLSAGNSPIPLLTQVLTYHVAAGALDSTDVLASDGIVTLQGGTLMVDGVSLVDADPDIANPSLIATDIPAANGIAHVLDGVLLPADLLQSNGSHNVDFVIADDSGNHIRVGRDNDFVDGKGGKDVIILGSGDDVGLGGSGNDIIKGGRGDDIIVGGEGHDLMIGGHGADTFVFFEGDGHDVIQRFDDGLDLIDLSGTGLSSFEDLHITQRNHVALIDISDDQSILVKSRHIDLSVDDFIF